MNNSRLRFKQYYSKQLKDGILTMRVDDLTSERLFKICNITSKSKSQVIREALWELFTSKYPEVI
jgi:predicted DNA-binding protein